MKVSNRILDSIQDQRAVSFNGKINILEKNSQQVGVIVIKDGEILAANYRESFGLKSFFNLIIDFINDNELKIIVEPEIVEKYTKNIHFPFSVLMKRTKEILENYKKNNNNRPPNNIKIYINPNFIQNGEDVTSEEFELLKVLIDDHDIKSIYKNCNLLDYEITNALVGLRKKNALSVAK